MVACSVAAMHGPLSFETVCQLDKLMRVGGAEFIVHVPKKGRGLPTGLLK